MPVRRRSSRACLLMSRSGASGRSSATTAAGASRHSGWALSKSCSGKSGISMQLTRCMSASPGASRQTACIGRDGVRAAELALEQLLREQHPRARPLLPAGLHSQRDQWPERRLFTCRAGQQHRTRIGPEQQARERLEYFDCFNFKKTWLAVQLQFLFNILNS